MIHTPSHTRVFLALGGTDMRKAIDGLSMLVEGALDLDPFLCGELRYVSPICVAGREHAAKR